jgi:hypothetical protein
MYKYPLIYSLSHLIVGFVSYKYLWLIPLIVIYQLIQYIKNIRFFFLGSSKSLINKGNNLSHTIYKLFEYIVGFVVAYIYYNNIESNFMDDGLDFGTASDGLDFGTSGHG